MLGRSQRINRERFQAIFPKGGVHHTPHLLVRMVFGQKTKESRGAVVVSKKVVRRATQRNRLKRRIYGALERVFPTLSTPVEVIIFVKKGAEKTPSSSLENEIVGIIKKQLKQK